MRPEIRELTAFGLNNCPEVPTYEAGYLVEGNGSWRSRRPIAVPENCTGCLQCYLYCPDGAVSKLEGAAERPHVQVDYVFCKGCGICAKVCRFDALHMEAEPHG